MDYIGIGDRLKDAAKKYTKGGGRGDVTIDVDAAFSELEEQIGLTNTFWPDGFDYSRWRALSTGDKQLLVSRAVNHIVKEDQVSEDFLEKTLKKSTSGGPS